jgi:hypothetical protein
MTMNVRRGLTGILTLAGALLMGTLALADEPERKAVGATAQTKGIASVTDAQGNPIPLDRFAAQPNALGMTEGSSSAVVRRGKAWWPYAEAMPPYIQARKRVEDMTEDEILVNSAAAINVRDTALTLGRAPKALLIDSGSQLRARDGFYLIKIRGFSRTQIEVDALTNAGVVLGEYLNVNTYVAKIPSSSFAAVRALPFVTFVGDYHPAYKISPRIGMEDIPVADAIDARDGQAKPWVLEVQLHKGADVMEVVRELDRLGIHTSEGDIVSTDAFNTIMVRTVPEAIPSLSQIAGVKFISERVAPELHASSTSPATVPMVLQNNGVFTTTTATGWKLWNAGIDGTGQIVTMMDSGLNTKMEHFSEDTVSNGTPGPTHRKVVGYDIYGSGDQCVLDNAGLDGGHGAKTSQHAVGSISNMVTNPDVTHTPTVNFDNGIARGAKVYFQDIGTSAGTIGPPLDLGPSITAAIGKGSFIQNHSWGAANNSYDTEASLLDTALFNNPNFLVTVSAGNRGAAGTGTLGSPSTAKNTICVGGNDVSSPNNLFIDCNWDGNAACSTADLGSSRGPVNGVGRIKPDIMSYIYSNVPVGGESMAYDAPTAMCQTDAVKTVYFNYTNVGLEGGTSFAAPDVAGLAALVRDYFVDGYYPTGSAVPANTIVPSGSLMKAVILASGEDMANSSTPTVAAINKRYSADVGYGRANLPGALHIGNGAPFLWVQNNDNVGDGSTKTFFYNINSNSTALRVMMVYYDSAGDALQKDADLKVTIGANVYWGNNFSAGWSTSATATRDHTNPTEGVFLDSAHGLPASGQVRVDVIGFNNPGGMNYSLVVAGDVASTAVTQVNLDKGKYTCNQTVNITVNDASASSPVSVTLVSKNAALATIDTQIVSCTGAGGVFTGSIQTGSGIIVADGGSLTATYPGAIAQATATVSCQINATDQGSALNGGCDNAAAGTDNISSPLFNAGANEFYTKYMDAGEYTSYTFRFKNVTGVALADATVNLSFSGAAASKMSVLNNPVHIGPVAADGTVGGVFQLFTDPTAAALTSVNLDFDITSPSDGYTVAKRLTQTNLLQANDQVTRLQSCAPFNTSISPFAQSTAVTGRLANTWIWSGAATTPATVSSENRTDGSCGSATINAAAMTGNSGTAANFVNNADNFLYINFQPSLRGNGPSGQPYRYTWKWHSFYHASEAGSNQSGAWGSFYNNAWNSAVAPTGDQLKAFPISLAYYFHTIFDYPSGGVGTWNWETANTGTPDDPHFTPTTGGAPNQLIITFNNISGLATSGTFFSYGHEHADIFFFNGGSSHGTHRDIALDNDRLVYDEYYAAAQAGASCGGGGQVGQVAFNVTDFTVCPAGAVTVSVTDANAVSGIQVTVASPGTGDSEVVTLTGSAPFFSANVNLSTKTGVGANNGTLFVLPSETITATYTDASPAGSTVASMSTACTGGDVVYVSEAQFSDNGDNDGIPDNNETVTVNITIKNNLATSLTNAKVKIFADSPNVDCVSDPEANYGTILAGASATNPGGDRFTFHVNPSVTCSDPLAPQTARFIVVITGDGIDGASNLQSFILPLNLDPTVSGPAFNYTQNFNSDPGWTVASSGDDTPASGCGPFSNSFHWCAACGNGSGGYGAWVGNSAFATGGQNYPALDSSTLYSPVFTANGAVGLQFNVAYRTEATYDGGMVQYSLNSGTWTSLAFTTPAQGVTSTDDFCSPFGTSTPNVWTGTGTTYTATNTASVPAAVGQTIQFRWRLGSDSSIVGTTYGGYGVDDVSITNLKQTVICEPTVNSGLPGGTCNPCASAPDGTGCNDGNACTQSDTCQSGVCVGANPVVCSPSDQCHNAGVCNTGTGLCSNPAKPDATPCNDANACTSGETCTAGICGGGIPTPPPGEATSVQASADKQTYSWSVVSGATQYDVVRGLLSALPVGPGGGDEVCFNDLGVNSVVDATTPAPGIGFFYLARGQSACGTGTYGTQSNATPRSSTTCP